MPAGPHGGAVQRQHQATPIRRVAQGEAANGAGRVVLQPQVNAGDVEGVPAVRQHPQDVLLLVLREANRTPATDRNKETQVTGMLRDARRAQASQEQKKTRRAIEAACRPTDGFI